MVSKERLKLFREYLIASTAQSMAIDEEDPTDIPDDSPSGGHRVAAEAAFDAIDEPGRNAIRWASAAIDFIERACESGDVPAPPWLEKGGDDDSNRAALAWFFNNNASDDEIVLRTRIDKTCLIAMVSDPEKVANAVTDLLRALNVTEVRMSVLSPPTKGDDES